jgi:hypothetical protein
MRDHREPALAVAQLGGVHSIHSQRMNRQLVGGGLAGHRRAS